MKSIHEGMKNKSTKFGDKSMTDMPKASVNKDAIRSSTAKSQAEIGPRVA